jgi:DNA mismatch endonuclease (patch repair protein)
VVDFISKEKRSKVMSAIRSKGNETTELAMIRVFRENGIVGWRRNYKLEGKPDFVFLKSKVVVFVDGCFWHGHTCLKPRDSLKEGFWKEKIERNKKRDKSVNRLLKKDGWIVFRIWECKIGTKALNKEISLIKDSVKALPLETRDQNIEGVLKKLRGSLRNTGVLQALVEERNKERNS